MDLTKIAYTPPKNERKGSVRIEWTESRFNAERGEFVTDERTLKSTDEPHPAFLAALQALAPVVAKACMIEPTVVELADAADAGAEDPYSHIRLTVRGLTLRQFEQEEEDVEGVTVTGLRELDWVGAPLVLNTPFAPVSLIPHPSAERLVEAVKAEARRFIGGKRAQAGLFDPVEDEAEMAEA